MQASVKPAPLYLIDGSSYLYRAYYAIRQRLTSRSGQPTGAIYGITGMLLKLLKEKDPTFIVMVWDAKGPVFRHELYPEYKANRPPMPHDLMEQVPWVRKVVDAMGIPQIECAGYEADDIIATFVCNIDDRRIVIVSGDKDLSQLVSERVSVWDTMKDRVVSEESIRTETGIEPSMLLHVMALSGDSSDNIPGVKGVGQKTALKLIKEYGTIDNIYANLNKIKGKLHKRLLEAADEVPLWKRLVALATDVPVSTDLETCCRRRSPSHTALAEIFRELDFIRLLKDLTTTFPDVDFINDEQFTISSISYEHYETVTTLATLEKWRDRIVSSGSVTIDTETTSLTPCRARLVGISICIEPPNACYIPVGHINSGYQLALDVVQNTLSPLFADPEIKKTGQNIKYDMIVLDRHGLALRGVHFDTMIASYLLDPSGSHGLDALAKKLLGHRMITFKEVTSGLRGEGKFARVNLDDASKYACEDAHITALVKEILSDRLKKQGLQNLFYDIEMPLVSILADMELAGIHLDSDGLAGLSSELMTEMKQLEEKIFTLAGEHFNINSPTQLAHILFDKLKLEPVKKTRKKTGYSTDAEVLAILGRKHPLPAAIVEYRNTAKLKSTYVESLGQLINPETGRIHTSFNQTVTGTGRLSSSNPNLQNIPVSREKNRSIRRLFTPKDGCIFLSADYSQIDLRVLAHYSGDDTLIAAFRNGEDIHKQTAAEIFQVHQSLVTDDMRRAAKSVNFGIVYGMSPHGLARELGISRKDAGIFIDRYFSRYPGVRRFMEKIIEKARSKGYVTTVTGRRRYIPDINSDNRQRREAAERQAINTPIQGSAADIIKLAMVKIFDKIIVPEKSLRILLQVHDELLFEGPAKIFEKYLTDIVQLMQEPLRLDVPLVVDLKTGNNWADMEKYVT